MDEIAPTSNRWGKAAVRGFEGGDSDSSGGFSAMVEEVNNPPAKSDKVKESKERIQRLLEENNRKAVAFTKDTEDKKTVKKSKKPKKSAEIA